MGTPSPVMRPARRTVLRAAAAGGLSLAAEALSAPRTFGASADTGTDEDELVRRLMGRSATDSPRVHLQMPAVFGNGYSVPVSLTIDSPMTEADHVQAVHLIAPRNPIIVAADFHFTPRSGRVAISTRLRLAQPQTVLALAELSDGTVLMARTWVKVDTDGCA